MRISRPTLLMRAELVMVNTLNWPMLSIMPLKSGFHSSHMTSYEPVPKYRGIAYDLVKLLVPAGMLTSPASIQSGIHWFWLDGDIIILSTPRAVEPDLLLIVKVPFIRFTAELP